MVRSIFMDGEGVGELGTLMSVGWLRRQRSTKIRGTHKFENVELPLSRYIIQLTFSFCITDEIVGFFLLSDARSKMD